MSGRNPSKEENMYVLNDIDLFAVSVTNLDANAYKEKKLIETEKGSGGKYWKDVASNIKDFIKDKAKKKKKAEKDNEDAYIAINENDT